MLEMIWSLWRMLCPYVELVLLAFLIYSVLYFLRGSRGWYVLIGICVLPVLSLLADTLKFEVIGRFVNESPVVLGVAIIVVFQPELRRAFAQIGSLLGSRSRWRSEVIDEVVDAAVNMSRRKCGALIVLERHIGLRELEEDAVRLDIKVNAPILESIFFPNSPLHDGAVIIRDNRIVAARAILPLTRNGKNVSKRLGTRHRAALGVTEETDAIAVVVSEETGIISVVTEGVLKRDLPAEQLEEYLAEKMMQSRTGFSNLSDFLRGEDQDGEDLR